MKAPPRVVLDTNVLVSALVFAGGITAQLRHGWQSDRLIPLASSTTAGELLRVLEYPKFRLSAEDREHLLGDILPWVRVVTVPEPPPRTPPCRDPSDLPFLHLALAGKAHVLVSGDQDLLSLAGQSGLCPIVDPRTFCDRYLTP